MRLRVFRHVTRSALAALLLLSFGGAGCSGVSARPRDVAGERGARGDGGYGSRDGRSPGMVAEPPPPAVQPTEDPRKPRLVTHASTRALAVDAKNLYYGDSEDDGIYAKPKSGGAAVRLARHAPVAGAIALDADAITWIASPGDAVLRIALRGGGQPTTLRDRGIFSDVATVDRDAFIVEALGAGGTLWRVIGTTTSRVAGFEGAPRAVMADATHAYIVTPTKILRTPYPKGEIETIATSTAFGSAEMDDASLYVIASADKSRVVMKIPKAGGPTATLATGVRDGPIDVSASEVFYFDATRSALRAVSKSGGTSRLVVADESLSGATAIEADGATVYVATGFGETGAIFAVDAN